MYVAPTPTDLLKYYPTFTLSSLRGPRLHIISGSIALHFFLQDASWSPNDLDVYVPDTEWQSLLDELTDPHGLRFVRYVPTPDVQSSHKGSACAAATSSGSGVRPLPPHAGTALNLPAHAGAVEDESDYGDLDERGGPMADDGSNLDSTDVPAHTDLPSRSHTKGLRDVRKFITPTGRRVDVIRSPTGSPITPLRFFWSTLVMNFITPRACVCGYPSATLERVGVLKQGRLRVRDKAAIAKYRDDRAFYFVGDEWRNTLEMWDHLFFGERDLLALDYRISPGADRADLPIKFTARGWVPTTSIAPRIGESSGMTTHCVACLRFIYLLASFISIVETSMDSLHLQIIPTMRSYVRRTLLHLLLESEARSSHGVLQFPGVCSLGR